MPNKRKRQSSLIMEVDGDAGCTPSFTDLPNEMLEKIFGYLQINELCRVGRVCRNWFHITRSPIFWKQVDTQFLPLTCVKINKLIDMLPPSVTHLALKCRPSEHHSLNMPDFSMRLNARCPGLKVLVFDDAKLRCITNTRINCFSFANFPRNLRVLRLRHSTSTWTDDISTEHKNKLRKRYSLDGGLSFQMIEVLDVSRSYDLPMDLLLWALLMIDLKELRMSGCKLVDEQFEDFAQVIGRLQILDLERTRVGGRSFEILRLRGRQLRELYLCHTSIKDEDIALIDEDTFPQLEIACFRGTTVTHRGIERLVNYCKLLKTVSISDKYLPYEMWWGMSDNSLVYCDHYMKVNYMLD